MDYPSSENLLLSTLLSKYNPSHMTVIHKKTSSGKMKRSKYL